MLSLILVSQDFDSLEMAGVPTSTQKERGEPSKRGPKRRPLDQVKSEQAQDRIEEKRAIVRQWALAEGVSFTQLCGALIYYENYRKEREIAKVGKGLFNKVALRVIHAASTIEAMYIRERFRIPVRAYNGIRFLFEDRFSLPPAYKVFALAKEMRPEARQFLDGVRCPFDDIMALTLKEQLTVCREDNPEPFGNEVTFAFSYGMDGSGSHSKHRNKRGIDTSSMFLGTFTVLSIKDSRTGRTIWDCKQRGHNSNVNTRPFLLVPQQESDELLGEVIRGRHGLDREISMLRANGLEVILPDGTLIKAKVAVDGAKMTQVDGKMIKRLAGLGGAYCPMCTLSEAECNDPDVIVNGIPIDRTMEQINSIAARLEADPETLVIPKRKRKTGDYPDREGVTGFTITKEAEVIRTLPILHAKIHCMDWLFELLVRQNSVKRCITNFTTGKENKTYGPGQKKALENEEKELKTRVLERLQLNISSPDQMSTGNAFKVFAEQDSREFLTSLLKDDDEDKVDELREAYSDIAMMLCGICKAANSQRRRIDVEYYSHVCTSLNLLILESFPWVILPESIHRLIAHSAELIEANDGFGLGGTSEEGIEGMIKWVRYHRQHGARTDSVFHNLTDVFNHLVQGSSPLLARLDRDKKRRKRNPRVAKEPEDINDFVESLFL